MGNRLLTGKPAENSRRELDLMEYRIIEGEPVRIYSGAGLLLREYRDFCEIEVPAADRPVIRNQVMIPSRE